ncbi:MAG: hypothetical protein V4570_00320 [Pseudomonadota bacterium]
MYSHIISISSNKVVRFLAKLALFFSVTCIAIQLLSFATGHGRMLGLISLFNLDQENNFPSFFSMLLLLFASLLLVIICTFEKQRANIFFKHWAILALGFLYMAMDEITSLHEGLIAPIRQLFGKNLPNFFHWAWVIPGILVVILVALYFYKFLLHLPKPSAKKFLFAAFIYLSGAIGMELINGYYYSFHLNFDFIYVTLTTIEESLEMAGLVVFIFGLLDYIKSNFAEIKLQIH